MIHLLHGCGGVAMRGTDEASGALFSYVDLEERVPAGHPLRKIRKIVNHALASLDADFDALYTDFGRRCAESQGGYSCLDQSLTPET